MSGMKDAKCRRDASRGPSRELLSISECQETNGGGLSRIVYVYKTSRSAGFLQVRIHSHAGDTDHVVLLICVLHVFLALRTLEQGSLGHLPLRSSSTVIQLSACPTIPTVTHRLSQSVQHFRPCPSKENNKHHDDANNLDM